MLEEFKQRRVFRALLAFGLVAFGLLQVVEPVMHGLELPDWVLKVTVVALGVGFPITLVLAWAFDLRDAGAARVEAGGAGARVPSRIGVWIWPLLAGMGLLIAAPGVIYYLSFRNQGRPSPTNSAPAAPSGPSVAVLAFVNLSADPEQDYFSDGLAAEILNALAHVPGLSVTGRTSSFSFKGKAEDLRAIGQKLNVSAILEGSVRKAGSRIRITAQLVKVQDGYNLWAETFDRELRDIFAVQDDIATAVVAALKIKLLPGQATIIGKDRPAREEVYSLFLLGRELNRRGSADAWRKSQEALEKALALDASYAPAWSALASTLLNRSSDSKSESEAGAFKRLGRAAAEKAVALAPGRADGYRVRGNMRARDLWDWRGAEQDFDRALALDPRDFAAIADRAISLLAPLGRLKEAIAETRRSLLLEPLSSTLWSNLCWLSLHDGQLGPAREACVRALAIAPENIYARSYSILLSLREGQPKPALAAAQLLPDEEARLASVAIAAHLAGEELKAQQALDELKRKFGKEAAYEVARVYSWQGQPDAAFEWLARAFAQHDSDLCSLKVELSRSLSSDRRWAPFLARMGLPSTGQ